MFRQRHRLPGDAEIAALDPAMLEGTGRGFPCDGGRNDDTKTANRRCRGDSDKASGGVEERSSCEAIVHWRSRPEDLVDRTSAARVQRTADDGDDARAGRYGVAPGSRQRQPDVSDAHWSR